MKCLICKADSMIDICGTYYTQIDHSYVIIENVPCKKCTRCGEVVYASSVMERIDDLLGITEDSGKENSCSYDVNK